MDIVLATYSSAFRENQNPLYKEVVTKTIEFLTRELYHSSGGFFASLDADSLDQNGNLVEGAFYVWNKIELRALNLLTMIFLKPIMELTTVAIGKMTSMFYLEDSPAQILFTIIN